MINMFQSCMCKEVLSIDYIHTPLRLCACLCTCTCLTVSIRKLHSYVGTIRHHQVKNQCCNLNGTHVCMLVAAGLLSFASLLPEIMMADRVWNDPLANDQAQKILA